MDHNILYFSPDLRPSLFSILKGLSDNNLLGQFVTTIAYDPKSKYGSLLKIIAKKYNIKGLETRELPNYLTDKTSLYYKYEIFRLLFSKFALHKLSHKTFLFSELNFDEYVAQQFAGKYKIAYGMEHSSLKTFKKQKKRNGFNILRQVMAHGISTNQCIIEENEKFLRYKDKNATYYIKDLERALNRKLEEYSLSDLIIANSEFVRKTFIDNGINQNKIVSIPTGFPHTIITKSNSGTRKKIRFLFAGTLTLRKGIQYLLEAWENYQNNTEVELCIAGFCDNSNMIKDINKIKNINYYGSVSRTKLNELYLNSDVLILPTLLEGLSHVVLEAMAYGLPIITTFESGCCEFIEENINGKIISSKNTTSICEAIDWTIMNKKKLNELGKQSINKALNWTINDSNSKHLEEINKFTDVI